MDPSSLDIPIWMKKYISRQIKQRILYTTFKGEPFLLKSLTWIDKVWYNQKLTGFVWLAENVC